MPTAIGGCLPTTPTAVGYSSGTNLTSPQVAKSPILRLAPFSSRLAAGQTVFAHACKLGLEGIVSKRRDSPYRSGRSPDWLKMKNPACAAVKREAEEDWRR